MNSQTHARSLAPSSWDARHRRLGSARHNSARLGPTHVPWRRHAHCHPGQATWLYPLQRVAVEGREADDLRAGDETLNSASLEPKPELSFSSVQA